LMDFLSNRGFKELKRPHIQQRLKDLNGGVECSSIYRFKDEDTGEWRSIRVWHVPEFDNNEIELPKKETLDDVPF